MAKRRMSTFERLKTGRLNRAQCRELGRRVAASDPGLAIVHANAGGIDVGNESHFVAVPPDRDENPVREFGCWTKSLNDMAKWLKSCRIDTVAVQATGVYWIALYDILEQNGIRVVLVNAQDTKNVPGRKTDPGLRQAAKKWRAAWGETGGLKWCSNGNRPSIVTISPTGKYRSATRNWRFPW
jgi:hypothetical protein